MYREKSLQHIAYHEAGHAVAAVPLCVPFRDVQISLTGERLAGGHLGHVSGMVFPHDSAATFRDFQEKTFYAIKVMAALLAGHEGEQLLTGQACSRNSRVDQAMVNEVLHHLTNGAPRAGHIQSNLCDTARDSARDIVQRHSCYVGNVAQSLLHYGRLSEQDVKSISRRG